MFVAAICCLYQKGQRSLFAARYCVVCCCLDTVVVLPSSPSLAREVRQKEYAVKQLGRTYSNHHVDEDMIKWCLYRCVVDAVVLSLCCYLVLRVADGLSLLLLLSLSLSLQTT